MKLLNIAFLLPALLLLPACSDDDKPKNTRYINGELPVVVIPSDASKDAMLTTMNMSVTQTLTDKWTYKVGVEKLMLPSGAPLAFMTPEMLATSTTSGNTLLEYVSDMTASTQQTIREFRAELINNYYYLSYGSPSSSATPLGTLVNISFKIGGDYSVNTFPKEAYYAGITTMADLMANIYEDKTIMYRVVVDVARGTAQVSLCNVKFGQDMTPLATLTLSGLKVTPSPECGYIISGQDVVPTFGAGQSVTQYPQYKFDKFEMRTAAPHMQGARITYMVAGRYKADFTGTYAVTAD